MSVAYLTGTFGSGIAPDTVPAPAPINGYAILRYSAILQSPNEGQMIPITPVRLPIVDGVLCGVDGTPSTVEPIEVQATDDPALVQEGVLAHISLVFRGGGEPVEAFLPLPAGETVNIATAAPAGGPGAVFVRGLSPEQFDELHGDLLENVADADLARAGAETARDEADHARADAEVARDDAIAARNSASQIALGDADEAMAAAIQNAESETSVALKSTFAQVTRGWITEGSLDDYTELVHVGTYGVSAASVAGIPPGAGTNNAVLEMQRSSSGETAILQRYTHQGGAWWREMINASSGWGVWRRVAISTDLDGLTPLTRGILAVGTNVDTLRSTAQVGTYAAVTEDNPGGPPFERTGHFPYLLVVQRGANNVVRHDASTSTEHWWRVSTSGSAWGPWRRAATHDDVTDIAGQLGAQIDYDDQGRPYLRSGSTGDSTTATRVVTDDVLDAKLANGSVITSMDIRRLIAAPTHDVPLAPGDLLFVYEED